MNKLKDYMMSESSEFSPVENNPLVYLLLIPKILHGDIETIKKDPIVKNVVDSTADYYRGFASLG